MVRLRIAAVPMLSLCLSACGSSADDKEKSMPQAGSSGSGAGGVGGVGGSTGGASGTSAAGQGGGSSAGSGGSAGSSGSGGGGASGSGGTGPTTKCDPTAPFDTEALFTGLSGEIRGARFTPDELAVVFDDSGQIYLATRSSVDQAFGAPVRFGVDVVSVPGTSWISDDRLTIVLEADDGYLYIAQRMDPAFAFAATEPLLRGADPYVVGGENGRLYFTTSNGISVVELAAWEPGTPEAVGGINDGDARPVLTPDELHVFFARDDRIVMAHRVARGANFEPAVDAIGPSLEGISLPTWISPDGCRLYFEVWTDDAPELHLAQRQ